MDASGKPEMSRELLERLMREVPGHGRETLGATTGAPTSRSGTVSRQHVRGYDESMLGQLHGNQSQVRQPGAEITRRRYQDKPAGKPYGQTDAGQNMPSAGFQEPPARSYNPYA